MTPRLLEARHLGEYRIAVRYEDGVSADLDLEAELWGEVFEPLRDVAVFRAFRIDDTFGTIEWPGGADFAPEFLYERARG